MTKDNGLVKGTMILGLSGIVVKMLSAAYRIPLTRMIGTEGMGQYTATFNFFMPFFSLAVAGITPAISRYCARKPGFTCADIRMVRYKGCVYFGTAAAIMGICSVVCAYFYSEYISSPAIFTGVLLLLPNLVFAAFEAVYKGINQGVLNMAVPAKSGVVESAAKMVIGTAGVYMAVSLSSGGTDARLAWAFATTGICGFICLLYLHRDFSRSYPAGAKSTEVITVWSLFSMAVPISLSALVVSLSNFCDTVICLPIVKNIPDAALMAAYPFVSFTAVEEKTMWLFGIYQGLCLSVVNLIPSLSAAIGASGLPVITRASGNDGTAVRRTDKLMKLTAAVVVPASMFVAFFSREVLRTLYGDSGARTALGAKFLAVMAPAAIPAAFSFPLNAVMHANKKSASVFRILLFSCVVKVALGTALCSVERINIMGCMFSQIAFHILVFVLSVITVRKYYPARDILGSIAYPAVLSYVLLSFIRSLSHIAINNIPVSINTVLCGGIFISIYFRILLIGGFFVD